MELQEPALPVYLIHWNAAEWCASAVRSLQGSKGVLVDLTVVDNGQDDGPSLESLLPSGVRVLRSGRNLGYSGGANLALDDWRARLSESELCLIGSHDLHVRSDALTKLIDTANSTSAYGILGPALLSPFQSSGGYWNGWRGGQFSLDGVRDVVDRDWVSGTCMLLRRACVESVSGFDEAFGSYVEDVDICLRARDAGWKVGVVTDATAWGLGSSSRSADSAMLANRALLVAKRDGLYSGTLRVAVDFGLLGLRILGASVGASAFWASARFREESNASRNVHARELRRAIFLLGSVKRRGMAGIQTSKKDFSETFGSYPRGGDGRTGRSDSEHPLEPLATIVITARGRTTSVSRTVASALQQSIRNLEVVIVDDASPEPYRSKHVDERVRVIRVEHAIGLAGARNRGLAAAQGQWIAFLDESDELEPNMLETSLRAVTESKLPQPVAAFSGAEVVDATGRTVEVRVPVTLPRGKLFPEDGSGEAWPINTLVVPTEVLRAVGGWDKKVTPLVNEDLFIRLNAVCSIQGVQELLCCRSTLKHSDVKRDHLGRAGGIARTLSKHRSIFDANPRARARLESAMGKSYLKAGRWLPAVGATTRALFHDLRRPNAFRQWVGSLVGPRAWAWYVHLRRTPPDAGS